ncbi:Plant Basic Secretory Protein containing protein [Coccidioides posadasii C735 delta SOWgp]|uniref:Plant Basic Secretory Protein containing protein n=1 Tax=Coccidioides posadasii (strain C735) TaxID=222929 RepID=C5P5C8_COCP7|nr:Plant Basic Secretory Protein containing protein [Coccidioides posadasii C735 delta SOWgp]EER27918.1 Plant Basic Secretory Protein containing protein [Coccidioides posadasii C735 delta SOWgp]|eukprot:XP_003070063.1 Plant Basic Secretory Protein containing protein [Coccidioides posadasii C735 delta SOWgp]
MFAQSPIAQYDDQANKDNNRLIPHSKLPSPKLRLHLQDITHKSAKIFLECIPDPYAVLKSALSNIITYLYTSPSAETSQSSRPCKVHFKPCLPGTRSVTVIIRDFSGVAHTTSIDLDSDHKEIYFSLSYIAHAATFEDTRRELVGVLTHELVHCYQHTSPPDHDTAPYPPSGLIEGIADFVRLKAGLSPPHWTRPLCSSDLPGSWNQGYQHTAFFLEWIEDVKVGCGAIGMLNDRLFRTGYVGEGENAGTSTTKSFWKGLFGVPVLELWEDYGRYLDNKGGEC